MLVGLDGSLYSDTAVELGLQWALRTHATLTGLAVVDEQTIRQAEPTLRGESYHQVFRTTARLQEAQRRMDHLLERFSQHCSEATVTSQALRKVGNPSEQILQEAEDYDLTLLGQKTYFHSETQTAADTTLDAVVRNSRRPVLAVPLKVSGFGTVVVAFDGSPPASRALEAFQRSGLFGGQSVFVVSTAQVGAEAMRHAEEGTRFLRFYGFPAEPRPIVSTRSTAEVLLEQVRELHADILVMGAYGRSVLREAFFGSTTQKVLEENEGVLFLHH
jgi:nucleotide-binding universal stress UspA family protein